jgi:uncharacterized peroxidase-related enzyme
METAKCMTTRPDLLPVYMDFVAKVRGSFSLGERGWKLITFIVAKHVPSTYCSMVYGKQLVEVLGSKEKVMAVQQDFRNAGLSQKDVAMLAYAEKIARDASKITQADIDKVRAAGFTDHEICDIALCAAFRCFISRFFDATGAGPEPAYIDEDAIFRKAMTVGKAA